MKKNPIRPIPDVRGVHVVDDLGQPHAVPPSGIPAGALLGNPEHAGGRRIRKNSDIAVSGEHPVLRPVRVPLSR